MSHYVTPSWCDMLCDCVTLSHAPGKGNLVFPHSSCCWWQYLNVAPRHPPTTAFLPTYIHLDSVCSLGQSMVGLWSQIPPLVRIIDIPASRIASKAVQIAVLEVVIL